MDLTLRLEADHWLGALKTGLKRLGEPHMANNVLCDIQADGSIHVTDPDSHRVFRIVEIPAAEPGQAAPSVTPSRPLPAVAAVPAPAPAAREPAAPSPAPAPEAGKPAPQPHRPAVRPSGHADHVVETRTPISTPAHSIGRLTAPARAEDLLADLFIEVGELGRIKDREAGLAFTLDTAMRIIGCEAGSVFTADLATSNLTFAVVRGPSADKVKALGLKIPVGVGLVGFCAQENVCVAVSDAEKDPRFYRAVSEATGYQTRSLLCAPMERHGQLVGCLEVLNKMGGTPFDQKDLAVLSYLAAQAAAFLGRFDT
jgi:hypothetical protein